MAVRGVEQRQPLLVAERGDAAAAHAVPVGVAQCAGDAAGRLPQPPADGLPRQSGRAAPEHQGIAIGVGGRVVGLAGAARGGGRGREHREEAQARPGRRGVQMGRAVGLDPPDRGQSFRVQAGDQAVVDDAGRVDHPGQRMRRIDPRHQAAHRRRITDVGGDDRDPGRQALGQFRRAG